VNGSVSDAHTSTGSRSFECETDKVSGIVLLDREDLHMELCCGEHRTTPQLLFLSSNPNHLWVSTGAKEQNAGKNSSINNFV